MRRLIVVLALIGVLFVTAVTMAGNSQFAINWWSVDGGGGTSTGGEYTVMGTIGQYDSHNTVSGGEYALNDGFWQPGVSGLQYQIYLPIIVRD